MTDEQTLKTEIESIIMSTWGSSYYQGGQEFTQSGRSTESAVKDILDLFHLERQKFLKWVDEVLIGEDERPTKDEHHHEGYIRAGKSLLRMKQRDLLKSLEGEEKYE